MNSSKNSSKSSITRISQKPTNTHHLYWKTLIYKWMFLFQEMMMESGMFEEMREMHGDDVSMEELQQSFESLCAARPLAVTSSPFTRLLRLAPTPRAAGPQLQSFDGLLGRAGDDARRLDRRRAQAAPPAGRTQLGQHAPPAHAFGAARLHAVADLL